MEADADVSEFDDNAMDGARNFDKDRAADGIGIVYRIIRCDGVAVGQNIRAAEREVDGDRIVVGVVRVDDDLVAVIQTFPVDVVDPEIDVRNFVRDPAAAVRVEGQRRAGGRGVRIGERVTVKAKARVLVIGLRADILLGCVDDGIIE